MYLIIQTKMFVEEGGIVRKSGRNDNFLLPFPGSGQFFFLNILQPET